MIFVVILEVERNYGRVLDFKKYEQGGRINSNGRSNIHYMGRIIIRGGDEENVDVGRS